MVDPSDLAAAVELAMIIPERIVEIRPGPDLPGKDRLVTLVLELERLSDQDHGAIWEIALPAYIFRNGE